MASTHDRYEYRAFARCFGMVETQLRRHGELRDISESSEIYIVSTGSDDENVKLRAGLLDVKTRVGHHLGLEQWTPTLKAELPMTAETLREQVLRRLGAAECELGQESYDISDLIEQVVRPSPLLVPASVHKCRWRFTLGECMAELTEVSVNGAWMATVCVESPDRQAVSAAVGALGLDAYSNESYLAAIKRVVGMTPTLQERGQ